MEYLERELRNWLSSAKRVVILGIGSPVSGDDAVGAAIAKRIEGKTSTVVYPLVCWTVPESCTGPTRRFEPSHILMIDAAELGRTPATCKLIAAEDTLGLALSSHSAPLKLLAEYLSKITGARIALLAIQPKHTGLAQGLSEELCEAAKRLADMLLRILPGEQPRCDEHSADPQQAHDWRGQP